MIEEQTWIKLVKLAQQGHGDSVDLLAREAQGRLCAYVYRVTLDYELTEDLSQEVLLQMVKSLDGLNKAESFWPWMYRIAQSKIQQHYKAKRKTALISEPAFYQDFLSYRSDCQKDEGLRQLVHKDLSKKVMAAMKQIRQQYRAVLSLRCFEDLSYSDIAVTMQCSEVRARVLFFRAKQALKKELSHQGVRKSLLLMCLGLFGRLTAPAEAASSTVSVSAAATKVGLTTAILATFSTKIGIATMTAAAVGLAGIGGISVLSEPPLPQRTEVTALHYTTQLRNTDPGAKGSLSKGAYEQWFYFPDEIDGPMFMRMQRWDSRQQKQLCSWLQDAQANYYYASGSNQVYIFNYRVFWSNLKVFRLPTDTAEFSDFLSQAEGRLKGVRYVRDKQTGLLERATDNRFVDARNFQTNYSYNTVGEEQFQYNWPSDVPVIDQRDQMHKRGWTYFRIDGKINNQVISGRGRIPFVYEAAKDHPAWITLTIGNELEIVDCNDGAHLRLAEGTVLEAYPPATFFQGLARPWMGMHTMNIVRRDAVRQRALFKTKPARNKKDVIVTLHYEDESPAIDLIYTIDMENDLLKDIRFDMQNKTKGSLIFSYLQDIDEVGNEFSEPAISNALQIHTQQNPGIRWLIYLAQGNLGK
jgi:RNA polymerase sigma-70 factor (ECF subfamily)